MGYVQILYEANEGVATIAINRPPYIGRGFGAALLALHGLLNTNWITI